MEFDTTAANFAETIITYLRNERDIPGTGYVYESYDRENTFNISEYVHASDAIMVESNYAMLTAELAACVGWNQAERELTVLDAQGAPTAALVRLGELLNDLERYPILCEDDYSTRRCNYADEHCMEFFGDDMLEAWRKGELTEVSDWDNSCDTVPAPDAEPEAEAIDDLSEAIVDFLRGHAMAACMDSDVCN